MIYDESHYNKNKTKVVKNLQANSIGILYKKKMTKKKLPYKEFLIQT